jgi:thiol-disulfide isomerase/thioredoxin
MTDADSAPDTTPSASTAGGRGPTGRGLSGRQIGIALIVALIAAVLTGVLVTKTSNPDDQSGAGKLRPAQKAPTTVMHRFDGTAVTLAEYKGQPVVVNFFASTCAPCIREMPDFEKVQRSVGDAVTFVGIAVQDDPGAAKDLVHKTGVTYDIAQDTDGTVLTALGGAFLPTTVLIDRDGTVVDEHTGQLSLDRLRAKMSTSFFAGADLPKA